MNNSGFAAQGRHRPRRRSNNPAANHIRSICPLNRPLLKNGKFGIILVDKQRRVLIVHEAVSGYYGPPKGSPKPSDVDIIDAALRELREETRIVLEPRLILGARVMSIGRSVFYAIDYATAPNTTPDNKEVVSAKWMPIDRLTELKPTCLGNKSCAHCGGRPWCNTGITPRCTVLPQSKITYMVMKKLQSVYAEVDRFADLSENEQVDRLNDDSHDRSHDDSHDEPNNAQGNNLCQRLQNAAS